MNAMDEDLKFWFTTWVWYTHSKVDRYTEAVTELQAALNIKKVFCGNHPEVAETLNIIIYMQASQGEVDSVLAKVEPKIFKTICITIVDEIKMKIFTKLKVCLSRAE